NLLEHHAHQGGFSRAGRADEEHEFPAGELDVEILHRGVLATHVRLGDVVEPDHCCLSRSGEIGPSQRRSGTPPIGDNARRGPVKTWSSPVRLITFTGVDQTAPSRPISYRSCLAARRSDCAFSTDLLPLVPRSTSIRLRLLDRSPTARASQHVDQSRFLPCSARQRMPASMNSSISQSNTEEGLPSC